MRKRTEEYIFIDFEMDVNCDSNPEQIISIGAIKTNKNGKIIDKFFTYSRLKDKQNLYDYTTYITGITDDMINNQKSFVENIEDLTRFINGNKNIYNWGWSDKKSLIYSQKINENKYNKKELKKNMNFLYKNLKDYRLFLPKKYKKFQQQNLFKVAKQLKIIEENYIQKHEAYEDAYILKEIFFKIKEV
jgi:DNA polymerase III alpha subunit (gram-positive type)